MIVIPAGTSYDQPFLLEDEPDEPIDLTSATNLKLILYPLESDTAALTLTTSSSPASYIEVTSASTGQITAHFVYSGTATFEGNTYRYEITATLASGARRLLGAGWMRFSDHVYEGA